LPLPKTVMFLTWLRRVRRHADARAVRKAVSEAAWTIPPSLPSGVKRFRTPVGLIGVTEGSADVAEVVSDTTRSAYVSGQTQGIGDSQE
jgi:hypothetical protein